MTKIKKRTPGAPTTMLQTWPDDSWSGAPSRARASESPSRDLSRRVVPTPAHRHERMSLRKRPLRGPSGRSSVAALNRQATLGWPLIRTKPCHIAMQGG